MEARSRLLLAALAGIALIAGLAVVGSPGADATTSPFAKGSGSFHVDCRFSHRANDDPIVFPRGPGASHSHDFFGNTATNAFTTPASLRTTASNCVRTNSTDRGPDHSAYWVPTLYQGELAIDPSRATAWYKGGIRQYQNVEPFPAGLMVVAGDSKGVGNPDQDGTLIYRWVCPGGQIAAGSRTRAPTCASNRLDLDLKFPDCWDGIHLDSKDHKSHMAYSVRPSKSSTQRVCPSTHPHLVPQLVMNVRYPTVGGPLTKLASGAMNTAHGDFMNGWRQDKLATLVKNCLNVDRYCGGQDTPVPGHP